MAVTRYLILPLVLGLFIGSLFHGWQTQHTLTFQFDLITAVIFFLTAVLAVGLSDSLVKTPPLNLPGGRETGTVKWFNGKKGYGFITREAGDDLFVHYRNIRGTGHRVLREGQSVDFIVIQSEKGPQADDVNIR